jgi:hypothetical protein
LTLAGSGADCAICRHLESELERLERDRAEKLGAVNGEWFSRDERQPYLHPHGGSAQLAAKYRLSKVLPRGWFPGGSGSWLSGFDKSGFRA